MVHPSALRSLLALALLAVAGCMTPSRPCDPAARGQGLCPPAAPREFRAAWVATVANIDWPSKPGLSVEQQKIEAIAILDQAADLKLNAIILQVRTSCDALYRSKLEPWSYYLTGQQGNAPDPADDPLKFWIAEAHKRGIELHAWFNPFRAKQTGAKYDLAADHVQAKHPDWVRSYGSLLWLDPGDPGAQAHTLAVMADVVKRYDVDGIHIDDYFYPYKEKDKEGHVLDFPDDATFARYQQSGGTLSRDDWRRDNINRLVHAMYDQTKRLKPWVKVGISPFGIWQPGHPAAIKAGFNQYQEIYADAKLWLNEGWVDYFTPQLYWKLESPQPYKALLEWWASENTHARHLWPGLYTSRITASRATTQPATTKATPWTPDEIVRQIETTRATPGATGHVHFSMICLMQDRQNVDEALAKLYAPDALVPASPWLSADAPKPVPFSVKSTGNAITVRWTQGWFDRDPLVWIVSVKYATGWRTFTTPGHDRHLRIPADPKLGPPQAATVSRINRYGNESPPTEAKPAR